MYLTKKQTSLLVVTILVIIALIWQIYLLMVRDIAIDSTITTAVASPRTENLTQKVPSAQVTIVEKTTPPLSAEQTAYIQLLNRYKLAKLENKLAQEQLSIADAKHKISVLTLDTKAFTHNKTTIAYFGTAQSNAPPLPKLVYLGLQKKHWRAILNFGNHYQNVSPGTQINNVDHVVSVSKNGVVIQTKKQRYNLSFNGVTPL